MSKNNENKLVPKLRFPEFINEKWEWKTIDETCEVLNNLRKPLTSNLREKGEYPYYGASGIIDFVKDFIFNERLLLIGEDGAKWGAYEKTAFIAEGKYWVNNHAHVLKPNGVVDTLLENYLVKLDISPFITGAAPPKLTLGKLKAIPVPIPNSRKEQQKIASCLSSLDELLTAERKKLEVLKDHKKGLLQNLLPQAGETLPKFRFKEFEDSGEWEIRGVDDNIDLISGIALKSEELSDDKSGTPILRGINITEGEIRHSDEMDKFYLGEIENIEKYLVEENDIVIGMDGSKVGKNVAIISSKDAGSILIQRVARIRAINSDIKYLYQHFLSNNFRNYVDVVNTSSGIPHISAKQIRDFQIGFPPSIEEQQKIASTLSSIDELIIAQGQKLEALQLHKKGLLQGLFPSCLNHDSTDLSDEPDSKNPGNQENQTNQGSDNLNEVTT